MNTYTIKATKDLIDDTDVKCFTKDKVYTFETHNHIVRNLQLENVTLVNDNGVKHRIGNWYKHFTLVKPGK